jgi:DNA mismatch endonuclease (patch repair protein)
MIENKDILKKVKRIVKIGNIKDRKIIEGIIGYEFKKRSIETREKEKRDKLSISLTVIESLNELMIYKETPIEKYMANAILTTNLPIAEEQYKIGIKTVDFAYLEQKLAVECDGYKWHKQDKEQIEKDIERDKYLAKKGWRVLHFSGVQIRRDIEGCINEIKKALFIK